MKRKNYIIILLLIFNVVLSQKKQYKDGWGDAQLAEKYKQNIIKNKKSPAYNGSARMLADKIKSTKSVDQRSAKETELIKYIEEQEKFEKSVQEEGNRDMPYFQDIYKNLTSYKQGDKNFAKKMQDYYNSPGYIQREKLEKEQEKYKKAQEEYRRQEMQKDLENNFNRNIERISTQNNTYNNLLIQNSIFFIISIFLLGLMFRKSKRLL